MSFGSCTLVDPDNRRAVDFAARHRALAELSHCKASDFELGDERAKLWLMQRTLQRRTSLPKVFGPHGTYRGLEARGALAEYIVAFARGERVLTIVPRLVARVQDGWLDTRISLPVGVWRNDLTGQRWSRRELACSELFREFPVALLTRED